MSIVGDETVTAADLAARIGGTKADDIRRTLSDLIVSGSLAAGTRLPTIRAVAAELDTSVGAVADAWAELRRVGLLDTRRRGGTTVAARTAPVAPARAALDLHRASPDAAFLPDLAEPLVAALAEIEDPGSTGALLEVLRSIVDEPTAPGRGLLALPGIHASMHLVLSALVERDGVVAIEDPTCIRNPKILAGLDARIVPIRSDAEGPIPDSVSTALEHAPDVLAFQTAAAVPLGSSLTERRRDELASLLESAGTPPWILEEDPAGPLASGASLAAHLPDRVVRVVDLSRAYGSVLQGAVVSAPQSVLRRVSEASGPVGAKTNPLLAAALRRVITDPATRTLVAGAAAAYARRNAALLDALAERGIEARGRGGYFVWIPVLDERDALLTLAQHGVSASPGSRSCIDPAAPHIRVATTRLPDDPQRIAELADAVAAAAAHTLATEDE